MSRFPLFPSSAVPPNSVPGSTFRPTSPERAGSPPTESEPTARSRRPSGSGAIILLGVSVTLALLGGWTLTPHGPFGDPDGVLARLLLDRSGVAWSLAVAALGGAVAAILWHRPGSARVVAAVATVELCWLGVGLQSTSTIALAGYLVAMALPLGLTWLAVQALRRYRRLWFPVLGLIAGIGGWGWATGTLRPAALGRLGADLGQGFVRSAPELVASVVLGGAVVSWLIVLLGLARTSGRLSGIAAWVRRHRRGLTLLAAAGPLPYALVRATWLTPWPLVAPTDGDLPPELRLWGLLLGGGAALGVVLTVGLIQPWGRRFPRWMPWCGGRPVPVRAAVIPGGLVAGIVCASALPMLREFLLPPPGTVFDGSRLEQLMSVVVFPFWLWGPALALAVWGYALDRAKTDGAEVARTGSN